MSAGPPVVVCERRGALGLITLNRPTAINALTHEMVRSVDATLREWAKDDGIATVAIVGAGERGLCAGGDVVTLYHHAVSGNLDAAAEFWRDEYRMIVRIAEYEKPIVAVQDGIVLGGGIGISGHAAHRIVTERSRLGFPEVTIGFVPDVGATRLLHRAGNLGTRLALTAEHIGPTEAIRAGFADWFVDSASIDDVLLALESEEVTTVIERFAADPPDLDEQDDSAFAHGSVGAITAALVSEGADDRARKITRQSPLAASVALEALRGVDRTPSLRESLHSEFRTSMNALIAPDFREGVRAQLIEKDRNPAWSPSTLEEVTPSSVRAFFAEPGVGDVELTVKS